MRQSAVRIPLKTHHQTRTVKTLGCLVFSMTAGAVLLSRAEPSYPSFPAPGEARSTPAQAISDIQAPESQEWQCVVVHYASLAGTLERPALVAGHRATARESYHFLVEPDGSVIASRAWREQTSIDGDRRGLHIGLAPGRTRSMVPRLQWDAFQQLLRDLARQCRFEVTQIRWDERSDTTRPSGWSGRAARLGDWLVSKGLSS